MTDLSNPQMGELRPPPLYALEPMPSMTVGELARLLVALGVIPEISGETCARLPPDLRRHFRASGAAP